MTFTLTTHAKQRMNVRKVTAKQVEQILDAPDSIDPNPSGDGFIYPTTQ